MSSQAEIMINHKNSRKIHYPTLNKIFYAKNSQFLTLYEILITADNVYLSIFSVNTLLSILLSNI